MTDIQAFTEIGHIDIDDYCKAHGMVDALTITVGELVTDGILDYEWFDFDAYDAAQRERLWQKFQARFEFREIGILPPGRWMRRTIARLNEIMPKYKQLYQAIDAGSTVMDDGGEWHKAREIYSSFPQQSLRGADADYASSGTDREHETVRTLGLLEVSERMRTYNDVDVMILDELEGLFMGIMSTDIPYL